MSTARERLERIQVKDGRGRYRGRSLIHEHDWQWMLGIAAAAIEAHESGALRYPTFAMKGHRALVVAIEDKEDSAE